MLTSLALSTYIASKKAGDQIEIQLLRGGKETKTVTATLGRRPQQSVITSYSIHYTKLYEEQLKRGINRHGKTNANVAVAATAGCDLRVDSNHFTGAIDQRPTGVTGVDRRVGLNYIVDREAVEALNRALLRRYDAGRETECLTERVADRNDRVAHFDVFG